MHKKLDMIHLTNPKKAVPIHYNDDTVFKSQLADFKRAVDESGLSERIVYLSHGETFDFEFTCTALCQCLGGCQSWAGSRNRALI